MILNDNLKGALLMTASMGAFTLNDVFVKLLAADLPLFQIVFLRGLLTTIMLAGLAAWFGQLRFRMEPSDRAKLGWRTVFEIAAMVAFLMALVNMPIANATAILAAASAERHVGGGAVSGRAAGLAAVERDPRGFRGRHADRSARIGRVQRLVALGASGRTHHHRARSGDAQV